MFKKISILLIALFLIIPGSIIAYQQISNRMNANTFKKVGQKVYHYDFAGKLIKVINLDTKTIQYIDRAKEFKYRFYDSDSLTIIAMGDSLPNKEIYSDTFNLTRIAGGFLFLAPFPAETC